MSTTNPVQPSFKSACNFFESLGYGTVKITNETPSSWEVDQFDIRRKISLFIKSAQPLKTHKATYFRYQISIEIYDSPGMAMNRLKHVMDAPPDNDHQQDKSFPLRKAFRWNCRIYILSTDVYQFYLDPEMQRIFNSIKKHIQTDKLILINE